MDGHIIKEFYCYDCGGFIRGDETQDEFPIRLTIYETCQRCALKKFRKEKGDVGQERTDGSDR